MLTVADGRDCALPAISCDQKKPHLRRGGYEKAIRGGVRSKIATTEEAEVLREYFARARDGTSESCPGRGVNGFDNNTVLRGLSSAVRAIFGAELPRNDAKYVNPFKRFELVEAALQAVRLSGSVVDDFTFNDANLLNPTDPIPERVEAARSAMWDAVLSLATEDHSSVLYPTEVDIALRSELGDVPLD